MDEFMVLVCFGFILCGFILGAPIGWVLGQKDAYGRLCDEIVNEDGYYGELDEPLVFVPDWSIPPSDHIGSYLLNHDETSDTDHRPLATDHSPEVHQ